MLIYKKWIPLLLIPFLFNAKCFGKKDKPNSRVMDEKVSEAEINKKISELITKADSLNNDNEEAKLYGKASELLVEKGDIKKAAEIARKGLRANPTNIACMNTIAEYYLSQGKAKEANSTAKDSLALDPNNSRTNYLLGNISLYDKKYKEAESYYKKALEIDPGYFESNLNLSTVYFNRKDYKESLKILESLIQKKPGYSITYKNAGITTEKLGDKVKAKSYYNEYLKLNPHAPDAETVQSWRDSL